uniref:Sodium channel modifier 1 zinc-finger domain-containing protein n=1 Tax=Nelumbo nucifera TaxID=4432 RepID=A0A822YY77_NELNU|nr:TPA_asm: hypothetical protein HUJ06_007804 [Nelumbo nucifera]
MSVFGGDSWAREAQHRKRRVDDLLLQGVKHNKFNHDGSDVSSSYKKLSNGKFACLVCPNNPILDSPLMLSVRKRNPPAFSFPCSSFSSIIVDCNLLVFLDLIEPEIIDLFFLSECSTWERK